ncbi:MAG: quinone oxidoreductase [Acidobacteriota bacterium]
MKAIRIHGTGGPEVLSLEPLPLPEPSGGEARVRLETVGVNFIDIYHRTGLYALPTPFTPGMEAAGVVEAVGPGVNEVKPGDRVAYAMNLGSYAQQAVVPAWKLVPVPEGVDSQTAAAAMLQGMTAHYLCRSTFRVEPGQQVLVHAAAGGVGLLLVQLAKRFGARVFGTVSTEAKADAARAAGADEVIFYTRTDFEGEIKKLTGGQGLDVVYDSVGKDTFDRSLNCLRPRGMLVLYGQSSGPVSGFDPGILAQRGSSFLTRPSLAHYCLNRKELLRRAQDLFSWLQAGELKLKIDRSLPLADSAEAHRLLEGRKTTGKLLLIP